MKKARLVILLLGWLMMAGTAAAQVGVSACRGFVSDDLGTLGGVEVEACLQGSSLRWTTVTDASGAYHFDTLPAGEYSLTFRMFGYETRRAEDLELLPGATLHLDGILDIAFDMNETIVPLEVASAPLSPGLDTRLSGARVQTLPAFGRTLADIAAYSPYMSPSAGLAGADPRHTAWSLGGAPLGAAQAMVPVSAVSALQVSVAPYDVRNDGFTGGAVDAALRRGDDTLRAAAYAGYRFRLGGDDAMRDLGLTVGGPILRSKLHFFAAADLVSAAGAASDPASRLSLLTRLDAALHPGQSLSLTALYGSDAPVGTTTLVSLRSLNRLTSWLDNDFQASYTGNTRVYGLQRREGLLSFKESLSAEYGAFGATLAADYEYNSGRFEDGGATAAVAYSRIGGALQASWHPSQALSLTAGLRIEGILTDAGGLKAAPSLLTYRDLGGREKPYATSHWPATGVQVMPRAEVRWQAHQDLLLRAGTGIFTSRPLTGYWAAMPLFVIQSGGDFSGGGLRILSQTIAPPQVLKTSLGADYSVPVALPLTISAECLWQKNISDWTIYRTSAVADPSIDALCLATTGIGHTLSGHIAASVRPMEGIEASAGYVYTHAKSCGTLTAETWEQCWMAFLPLEDRTLPLAGDAPFAVRNHLYLSASAFIPVGPVAGRGLHADILAGIYTPADLPAAACAQVRLAQDIAFRTGELRHDLRIGVESFTLLAPGESVALRQDFRLRIEYLFD